MVRAVLARAVRSERARLERECGMGNFFRTVLAGYGAHKLGGGCISTILIFIVLYWILGAFC